MYKNQLQELAQRSCFNLPSYSCIREGPDHAPRFKAAVNFNGEVFESPTFCTTLRQAEHAAAEVALHSLSSRAPSHSLAARILDETGVYKNLLQEISQRVGAPLPSYTTCRSGLGHLPVFTCTVELAGITFTGEPAKNKKQAEKNAAMAAWSSLKKLAQDAANSSSTDAEQHNVGEQEQITIARALLNYKLKEKLACSNGPTAPCTTNKFLLQRLDKRRILPPFAQSSPSSAACSGSKILPLFRPSNTVQRGGARPTSPVPGDTLQSSSSSSNNLAMKPTACDSRGIRAQRFPAAGAPPYVPVRQLYRSPSPTYHHAMGGGGMAPPVTIRTAVPVFSAPPMQQHGPSVQQLPSNPVMGGRPLHMAPPVHIRQAVPVFAAPTHVNRPPPAPTPTGPTKEQGYGVPGSGGTGSSIGGGSNVAPVQQSDDILPLPPPAFTTIPKETIPVTPGPGPGSGPNMEPQLQMNALPEIPLVPQPVTTPAAKGLITTTSNTVEQQQQRTEGIDFLKQVSSETTSDGHASSPDTTPASAAIGEATPLGNFQERALFKILEHLSIKSNKKNI